MGRRAPRRDRCAPGGEWSSGMDTFVIEGGRRLQGRVRINGAKNAALPLMAAALLTSEKVTLRDIPPLADIRNMERLLAELGCPRLSEEDGVCEYQSVDETASHARYDVVRTMRA